MLDAGCRMTPAVFDHRWVHPWRRPAWESRSVHLAAEPARVVSPLPPYEPELAAERRPR